MSTHYQDRILDHDPRKDNINTELAVIPCHIKTEVKIFKTGARNKTKILEIHTSIIAPDLILALVSTTCAENKSLTKCIPSKIERFAGLVQL